MEIGATGISKESELKDRLGDLIREFAVEHRDVVLASGQKSSIYIDCRQVYFRGEAQFIVGELFFESMIKAEGAAPFIACGGMAMGSIPLTCALTFAAFRRGRELPGFAVRKTVKDHGIQTAIEGAKCLRTGGRVVVVEDVVTTATSSIEAIERIRAQSCVVDTVIAIVDREQGGRDNLEKIGVRLHSLFSLKELAK